LRGILCNHEVAELSVTSTDRIEKRVLLRAPRARVWAALTDAKSFGEWFHAELRGTFAPGEVVSGRPTYEGYEHVPIEMRIERVEPERLLSWRWHPYTGEEGTDPSAEPATLVVFELEATEGGTLLTIVESGFDAMSPERRAKAYRGDEEGWTEQMRNIERYVAGGA
jgi:uncharacterized protein YndB with AHSA1/START domain